MGSGRNMNFQSDNSISARSGLSPELLEEIRALARKHKVQRVVLFGSRARGDHWRASDIDLACSGGNISGFAADVDDTTSTALMYDVIDLDKATNEELISDVQHEGIPICTEVQSVLRESAGSQQGS